MSHSYELGTIFPIVDCDVIPFGVPPEPPIFRGGSGQWDASQIGLVVERGDGYVDLGLPSAAPAVEVRGIHGIVTFTNAQVVTVKDWLDDGTVAVMSDAWHTLYGLEAGDDGIGDISISNPNLGRDEADWDDHTVEFWMITAAARDCIRIELEYLGAASMRIDYIEGYTVDDERYGLGHASPADSRAYGDWIPLTTSDPFDPLPDTDGDGIPDCSDGCPNDPDDDADGPQWRVAASIGGPKPEKHRGSSIPTPRQPTRAREDARGRYASADTGFSYLPTSG